MSFRETLKSRSIKCRRQGGKEMTTNWSNCPIYEECGDKNKSIMTYCDFGCSNPKRRQPTSQITKGEWKAHRNALGTWTIETDLTRIGEVDRHFNAHLIVAAINACKEINPFNPMAVAESITKLYEALKELLELLDKSTNRQWRDCYADSLVSKLEKALADSKAP